MNRTPEPRLRALKRPLHHRVFALFWALAFVLGTAGDGFGMHPCPHHSGGTEHASESGNETRSGAHRAAYHGDAAHASGAEHHAPDQDHSSPCTCGAACQAGSGVALPGMELSQPGEEVVDGPAPVLLESSLTLRPRPPFFLPLAQAPPA